MAAVGGPEGTLYVVGTPIGNLDDLSPRAVEAFASSDLVACEDTRRTRILLSRHGLSKRMVSYHAFNEKRRLRELLEALGRGRRIALASDGGTPGVSDPGALLVRAAREAGHRVVPVPGPSALTALVSASGFPPGPFTFIGFLPHRKGARRRALQAVANETRPLLFFESPRRLLPMLADALEILGDRDVCLGREMTKLHEEILAGTIRTLLATFEGREVRGEIALMLSAASPAPSATRTPASDIPAPESPADRVRRLIEAGVDRKEALRRVAREAGVSRRELYRRVLIEASEEE
ncbi:MAG TPA: 16S rRNA (cytidine(1402)-2'-O)-methyltransferase [Candidatus Polarisedimenticolia bacterium]|nr:16S rRNA (cytidine(1402)-2'-O)-methyltransferase [Candidatus Polarisedimenticolia bacterium]